MISETLIHDNGEVKVRVFTERFLHYLRNYAEGQEQVVIMEYLKGRSAENMAFISVEDLIAEWNLPLKKKV